MSLGHTGGHGSHPHFGNQLDTDPSPGVGVFEIEDQVKPVFQEVASRGDDAVRAYTSRFDGVDLENALCAPEEFQDAELAVPADLKTAIQKAKSNIERFHSAQQTGRIEVETAPGVLCWQEKRPIEKVGLYIPGGTAPLFSTILMLAIPAQIAGCLRSDARARE